MTRIISLWLCAWVGLAQAASSSVIIKAGHLVDVFEGKVLDNMMVLVEGETVKAVGPKLAAPANATVLDLGNAWVLPGLIDCHTHITSQMENYYEDIFRKSPIDEAVFAHVYARRTLDAGFTTCRNVGANEFVDVALKKVIDAGKVPGPHLFVSVSCSPPPAGMEISTAFRPTCASATPTASLTVSMRFAKKSDGTS